MSDCAIVGKRILIAIALCIVSNPAASAKLLHLQTERVSVKASAEEVFGALRMERTAPVCHRKLICFDGKVARIDEQMTNVPIYGKVHCIWEETEFPYTKMDYKMIESDHFKVAYGSWVIVPTSDQRKTTLELRTNFDSGLTVPFSDQITRVNASRDAKERLKRIKEIAERDAAQPKAVISSSEQSK
jgi:hypothetical protein